MIQIYRTDDFSHLVGQNPDWSYKLLRDGIVCQAEMQWQSAVGKPSCCHYTSINTHITLLPDAVG